MKRLEKIPAFPYYVFLIPVFYVWHKLNEYFGLVKIRFGIDFLLKYQGVAIVLLLFFRLITKKWTNAGLLAAAVLLFLLHWGIFHDWIKGLAAEGLISSYSFLLPFFLVAMAAFAIYLKKREPNSLKLSRYLNLLLLLLLLIEAGTSIFAWQFRRNTFAIHAGNDVDELKADWKDGSKELPDIYWIIFDEYASSKALQSHLGFDNSVLDTFLVENNFRIIWDSKSNYNLTPYSIASTLDLSFLDASANKEKLEVEDMMLARKTCSQTILPTLLKESGYRIRNLGLFDLPDNPAPYGQLFEDMDEGIFINETFEGRFYKEIWWNFRPYWPFGPDSLDIRKKMLKPFHINQKNFEDLISEMETGTDQPVFVYAHFLMPHSDYLVDRYGNERLPRGSEYLSKQSDSLYLDQLMYSNTWIEKIASLAHKERNRPRVVIIQGDHGRRTQTPSEKIPIISDEKSFMNLNAIYFSDGDYRNLYDSLSSVNTFRLVLNKYFQTSLPLLPDTSVLILRNAK